MDFSPLRGVLFHGNPPPPVGDSFPEVRPEDEAEANAMIASFAADGGESAQEPLSPLGVPVASEELGASARFFGYKPEEKKKRSRAKPKTANPKPAAKPKAAAKPKTAVQSAVAKKSNPGEFLQQKFDALRSRPPMQVAQILNLAVTLDGEPISVADVALLFNEMTGKSLDQASSLRDTDNLYAQRPAPPVLRVATALALADLNNEEAPDEDFW
jgi:hypothetical protein